MKVQITRLFTFLLFFGALSTADAQIVTPRPSPNSTLKQDVGLTEVTIEYSRPSMKGRKIFAADGLVPYGKMWRLGANSATKFTFGGDVKLGGKEVKKGSYAVLVVPNATEWKVNLYPYESSSWPTYVEKEPAVSFMAEAVTIPAVIESFMIDINNLKSSSATIDFIWENIYVSIPVEAEVETAVMKNIDKVMAGPSNGDYYAAATYYFNEGKDLNKALEWIQIATSAKEPRFWHVRRESLILADLGRYSEAVTAAKRSLELSAKAGNDDYVKMNKDSIAEWMKK